MRNAGVKGAGRGAGALRLTPLWAVMAVTLLVGWPRAVFADMGLDGLWLEAEVGPGLVLRNNNSFGEQGTLYSASDINQSDTLFLAHRVSAEARLGARHGLVLLYAPLPLVTEAVLPLEVRFNDVVFPEGTPVRSTYVFNGYRASYLYRVVHSERLTWEAGLSLQIRTASVQLESLDGTLLARVGNIGPVPALKTRLQWRPSESLWVALEADGLVAPGGRGGLYDAALTLGFPVNEPRGVSAFLRLRGYGGGADVEDPRQSNFGDFVFALAGVRADLVSLLRP